MLRRWVLCVTLFTLSSDCVEYTRRRRLYNTFQIPQQFDMPTKLQQPNHRNPLTELSYDLPSSSKPWASTEKRSQKFSDDQEDLDNKCSAFPNQTLFQPHFFSCDSIGEFIIDTNFYDCLIKNKHSINAMFSFDKLAIKSGAFN